MLHNTKCYVHTYEVDLLALPHRIFSQPSPRKTRHEREDDDGGRGGFCASFLGCGWGSRSRRRKNVLRAERGRSRTLKSLRLFQPKEGISPEKYKAHQLNLFLRLPSHPHSARVWSIAWNHHLCPSRKKIWTSWPFGKEGKVCTEKKRDSSFLLGLVK